MKSDTKACWQRYAYQGVYVPLDRDAYQTAIRRDGRHPLPEWVCLGANGSLHAKDGFERLEIHVARPPQPDNLDYCMTRYGINVARTSWLETFIHHVPSASYILGDLIQQGSALPEWRTIVTRSKPRIRHKMETVYPPCGICGKRERYSGDGDDWLDERDTSDDVLFCTEHGLFLRLDFVEELRIPIPVGVDGAIFPIRFGRV